MKYIAKGFVITDTKKFETILDQRNFLFSMHSYGKMDIELSNLLIGCNKL
jgi:hypothetical protein